MTARSILCYAHKGRPNPGWPPNALRSIEESIQAGVAGLELDINETRDGEFLVFHDHSLEQHRIGSLALSEASILFKDRGESAPLLGEVIDLCVGKTRLMLDLKQMRSLDKLARMLKQRVPIRDLTLTSFTHPYIRELSASFPEASLGILTGCYLVDPIHAMRSARAGLLVQQFPLVDGQLVSQVHNNGYEIYVWDVGSEVDIRETVSLGVDGLIADDPVLASQISSGL